MIQVQWSPMLQNTQLSTFKKEGFLCGFALQNKMQNKKYLPNTTKCRILDFIRFMVSRDFGKRSLDTISMIWMCSRAFLHMFWSALTRELQIEKGKQDWQDESDPQNWHEALQFPKLRWQQKQSSLTMFTGLSYSQLMSTPWQATEQYKNTRDPYKSTHNLQFTIYNLQYLSIVNLSCSQSWGPDRTHLQLSDSHDLTAMSFWLKELSKGWWWKGPPTDTALHFCLQILQPFLVTICDHGITANKAVWKALITICKN